MSGLWQKARAEDDQDLGDLIDIGRYSGMRIAEICSNKIERNGGDFFRVEDAKTEADWREVPIHSKLDSG